MLQAKDLPESPFRLGEKTIKVLALEAKAFRWVLSDSTNLVQVVAIVLLGAVASGLGTLDDSGISTLVPTIIIALFGWVVWSWLIYVIGTRSPVMLFPKSETPSMRNVFRVIGFAQAPAMLRVVGIFSSLGPMIAIISLIWIIVAMSVGTNQLFGTKSLARSSFVVLISFIPYILIVGGFTLLTTS
jgi:hypothetical protein